MDDNIAGLLSSIVSGLVGVIVARGMAGIEQLETYYSYEDALDLLEITQVNDYNEYLLMEEARRSRKLKHT